VESTHGDLKFTAPLLAITAAVVGVVVNLAIFFAYHVWLPQGLSGSSVQPDWLSVLISAGAVVALFYFKRTVLEVLGASAVIGVGLVFWGLPA